MIELFSLPFMQLALAAGLITGVICAVLGIYVVLKRMVFFTAMLAQVSSAGVALAFLLGLNPSLFSLVLVSAAVLLFAVKSRWQTVPLDSVLGIGFVGAFALSILFMAKSAQGMEEIQHLLQGNILTLTTEQVGVLAGVSVLVLLVHFLLRKEFLFVAFDPEMARTQGYRVTFWNFLLYFTMGLIISLGIRTSGLLMIFAMLVIPAVVALQIARSLRSAVLLAVGSAIAAVLVGLVISFQADWPSGPTIVAVLLVELLLVNGALWLKR